MDMGRWANDSFGSEALTCEDGQKRKEKKQKDVFLRSSGQ